MKPRRRFLPTWKNALLALLAAGLLILAFPDFDWWWTAWFALVPLMWAVEREKGSVFAAFLLGWLFGTAFFFGTCWWLTYAPIHYAAVPWPLAYLLIFVACLLSGLFPGLFAATLALLLRRFGSWAFLAAPFVWVASEFARYWITGNDWNATGYSQFLDPSITKYARIGGVLAVSFAVVFYNLAARGLVLFIAAIAYAILDRLRGDQDEKPQVNEGEERQQERPMFALIDDNPDEVRNMLILAGEIIFLILLTWMTTYHSSGTDDMARVIAVQPNVPMSGLDQTKWWQLRQRQVDLAEVGLRDMEDKRQAFSTAVPAGSPLPTVVILPESPMNFAYEDDREFHKYINDFAAGNNVSVLFNSSEPDKTNGKYFNSAVMVGPDGKVAAEYDKIYLLPFGEAVPFPFEGLMPAFVGSFSYGSKYDLVPLGDAKAGVMICFESHFGELSRRYVQGGADAIIEMTNDGYLGPTPVLRQHLANAVFRAVETNRPVLRVTNVGITAYIDERGNVIDPLRSYTEGTRVWTVSKSDGSQTFYVKYGDWFAWLCSIVTVGLLIASFRRRRSPTATNL